jgi:large subunit ribosomal protein L13
MAHGSFVMVKQKTTYPKKETDQKQFLLFDADGQVLGRLAAKVAAILRGKHKPQYHPAVDMGDYVIIVNADKVRLTGRKLEDKLWQRHSGTPGGFKETQYKKLIAEKPEFVIRKAVTGMLPHNSLGRQMVTKLKVYKGPEHPHKAQNPVKVEL